MARIPSLRDLKAGEPVESRKGEHLLDALSLRVRAPCRNNQFVGCGGACQVSVVLRADGVGCQPEVGWFRCSECVEVHDIEPAKAPLSCESDASAKRRVIRVLVCGRRVEHHEGGARSPRPNSGETIAIRSIL
jgi:hypothetical protein